MVEENHKVAEQISQDALGGDGYRDTADSQSCKGCGDVEAQVADKDEKTYHP